MLQRISKKVILTTTVVAGIVIIALGVFFFRSPAAKMQTVTLKKGDMTEAAYAVGTVKAERSYNLKTGAPSRVIERYVRIGDKVKKGDRLVQLEGFPTYYAPFDGVITALAYEKGELVFAQTAVVTLVDYNSFYLELNMDERTISSIRKGQDVRISFEGSRDTLVKGTVRTVYASEGDFLVAVDADFGGLSLLPGMTCDVAVQIRTFKDQLLVPLGAVSTGGDVIVVREKEKITVPVVRGASDGEYTLITSGNLREGDTVLIPKVASAGGSPH